jgi:hypothetical protein
LSTGREGQGEYATPASSTADQKPSTSKSGSARTDDGAGQAAAIANLLQMITVTGAKIPDTLGSCVNLESDFIELQQVISERAHQLDQARKLHVDQIPGGDTLKQALVNMIQKALDVDKEYENWAGLAQATGRCTDGQVGSIIDQTNQTSADAKREFVSLWNNAAEQYGFTLHTWNDF